MKVWGVEAHGGASLYKTPCLPRDIRRALSASKIKLTIFNIFFVIQEAFTCTSLKVHPHEAHFVAQSNGNYIALFSTRRPYKLNKFKRYEGHKVFTKFLLLIKWMPWKMGYTLHYTVISMGTHTPPPTMDGELLMSGTLKEPDTLQWEQMKRANPLPPGLSQINTAAVFIHCTVE